MNKADLITVIADKVRFPWARAELLVEQIFSSMADSLMRGEKIEIRGFGSFQVRSYGAYRGRNPRTGQIVDVSPKRLPHFKVSIELAARVNDGRRSTKAAAVPEPIKPRAPVATVAAREPSEI